MLIASIQRFCMHDGDGVRTTVFLKGCPLSCAWCHNPETQSFQPELLFHAAKCIGCGACGVCPRGVHGFAAGHTLDRGLCTRCGVCGVACPTEALELCGKEYTAEALLDIVLRDKDFYGTAGGVTLSGGEPLLSEEASLFLKLCREHGLNTAVETCGMVSERLLREAIPYTDLFLWDVKDTDELRHQAYTGVSYKPILKNLLLADSLGAKTRLRCILVKGVNTNEGHYKALAELFHRLQHCEGVEFLPYHTYGDSKAVALGQKSKARTDWIPSEDEISYGEALLRQGGVTVISRRG